MADNKSQIWSWGIGELNLRYDGYQDAELDYGKRYKEAKSRNEIPRDLPTRENFERVCTMWRAEIFASRANRLGMETGETPLASGL